MLIPITPIDIKHRHKNFMNVNDSPKNKIPAAVTTTVPNALHIAYATETSIFANAILKPNILYYKYTIVMNEVT